MIATKTSVWIKPDSPTRIDYLTDSPTGRRSSKETATITFMDDNANVTLFFELASLEALHVRIGRVLETAKGDATSAPLVPPLFQELSDLEEPDHVCPKCRAVFDSDRDLIDHIAQAHFNRNSDQKAETP